MGMARGAVAIATAVAVFSSTAPALAQCKADTDCKGQRICKGGQCVEPAADKDVNVTYSAGADEYVETDAGWAFAGGIIGFIGAVAVLGLAAASEATATGEEQIPSLPLGIAATVLLAALGPVTAAAGGSARRAGDVSGILALRIVGWITYGVAMAEALALILIGALDVEPVDGLIITTGLFGAASLTCFGIDAVVGHSQASAALDPGWGPSIAAARDNTNRVVPTVGVGYRF